jgi:hypothetical protein
MKCFVIEIDKGINLFGAGPTLPSQMKAEPAVWRAADEACRPLSNHECNIY